MGNNGSVDVVVGDVGMSIGWCRVVRVVGLNGWLRWLRVGTVNEINTVVVDGARLKNAVIGVAGLTVGALRLRLPLHLCVLSFILCYLCALLALGWEF